MLFSCILLNLHIHIILGKLTEIKASNNTSLTYTIRLYFLLLSDLLFSKFILHY